MRRWRPSGVPVIRARSSSTQKRLMRIRLPSTAAVVALLASSLAGCGTVNERLSAGMGDYVPQWAGGLPADAPPRAGTPQYDAYMKERERKRLMPAADREKEEQVQKGTTGTTSGSAVR